MCHARGAWRPRARRPALAAVLAALVVALPAQPGAAHTELVRSAPGAGTTLAVAPRAVELEFNDTLLNIAPIVLVRDAAGTAVAAGAPRVEGNRLTAALPAGTPGGDYRVTWRVVAEDGHPIQGVFAFSVAGGAPEPSVPPSSAAVPPTEQAGAVDGGVPVPALAAGLVVGLAVVALLTGLRRGRRPVTS